MKNYLLLAIMALSFTSCSSDNNEPVTDDPQQTNTNRYFTARNLNPSSQSLAGMVAYITSTVNYETSISGTIDVKVGDVILIKDPNNTFGDSPRIEYTIKNQAGDVIQTSVVKRIAVGQPWVDETTNIAEITVE